MDDLVKALEALHYEVHRTHADEVWRRSGKCHECRQPWPCATALVLQGHRAEMAVEVQGEGFDYVIDLYRGTERVGLIRNEDSTHLSIEWMTGTSTRVQTKSVRPYRDQRTGYVGPFTRDQALALLKRVRPSQLERASAWMGGRR